MINNEWSTPTGIEYGKNIRILSSKGNYTVNVFSADGTSFGFPIMDERKVFEIEAYKISTLLRPMIKFKANLKVEMRLEIYNTDLLFFCYQLQFFMTSLLRRTRVLHIIGHQISFSSGGFRSQA